MTRKEELFCEEYLLDLNATQAAIRAGYSARSAKEIGYKNLTKHHLCARIGEAMAERSKRTGINQERVLLELARLAFVNAADVIDFDNATIAATARLDDTAAIVGIKAKSIQTDKGTITEREIKLFDKTKTLELLCKHLGIPANGQDSTAPIAVIINYDYEGWPSQNVEKC